MGLFDGLSTPKWISPMDSDLASAESTAQFGRNSLPRVPAKQSQNHRTQWFSRSRPG